MEHVTTNLESTDLEEQPPFPRAPYRVRSVVREVAETIVLTLLIFFLVRANVQNFKVEGSSMEPNLHNNQYLLVNKAVYFNIDTEELQKIFPALQLPGRWVIYLFESPQRGDVVVFRFPRDPSRDFIKRVIGVPGDVVDVKDGVVHVNGIAIDEPYIRDRPSYAYGPHTVPPDQYFVLGDNRNNSSDSHIWEFVPRDNIVGKAWLVYWPISSWGVAPNVDLNRATAAAR